MSSWSPGWIVTASSAAGRVTGHPAAGGRVGGRQVHEHAPAAVREQVVVVQAAGRAGGFADRGLQLGHGAGVPGEDLVVRDVVLDRGHRGRRDRAELDVQRRRLRGERRMRRTSVRGTSSSRRRWLTCAVGICTVHPPRGCLAAHVSGDTDAALAAFTPTAVVVDDGTTYRGTEEIRGFLSEAGAEFSYTTTLVGAERTDGTHRVAVNRLEGDFPVASSISATASSWWATDRRPAVMTRRSAGCATCRRRRRPRPRRHRRRRAGSARRAG
jgi:hypothetical protein